MVSKKFFGSIKGTFRFLILIALIVPFGVWLFFALLFAYIIIYIILKLDKADESSVKM